MSCCLSSHSSMRFAASHHEDDLEGTAKSMTDATWLFKNTEGRFRRRFSPSLSDILEEFARSVFLNVNVP
ncbi:hypothetical protein TNCV_4664611 [Trichonephila clavipes]|nr:hypothetical protein TNCV_4664611 [Trichonephila clavipes]